MVWAVPVSLAATQGIAFAFSSSGYLDVSVPRVCLLMCYEFTHGSCPITGRGFPHSEISGSTLTYSSPKHIGVSAVLLRLLVPRHPPCALSNLTKVVRQKVGCIKTAALACCLVLLLFNQCRFIQFSKNKFESLSHMANKPSKLNAKR